MSEYTDERDRKCPRCGKPLPLEISVRAWHLEECGNYSTRKDKLARIDDTARAIFVAVKAAALQPNSPYDLDDMAVYASECYADALALESARAEAIRELDKEPR